MAVSITPYTHPFNPLQALPSWPNVLSTGTRPLPSTAQSLANGSASQPVAEAAAPAKTGGSLPLPHHTSPQMPIQLQQVRAYLQYKHARVR